MSEPVTVRFLITLDDVVDGTRLLTRRHEERAVPVIGTLSLAAAVLALLADVPVGAGILAIVGVFLLASGPRRRIERWLLERQVKHVLGVECVVTAEATGVRYVQSGVSAHWDYRALDTFDEDEHSILVAGRATGRLVVPKHAFGSTAELDRFRAIVAEGLRRGRSPSSAA